jgi:hypothetical protein
VAVAVGGTLVGVAVGGSFVGVAVGGTTVKVGGIKVAVLTVVAVVVNVGSRVAVASGAEVISSVAVGGISVLTPISVGAGVILIACVGSSVQFSHTIAVGVGSRNGKLNPSPRNTVQAVTASKITIQNSFLIIPTSTNTKLFMIIGARFVPACEEIRIFRVNHP